VGAAGRFLVNLLSSDHSRADEAGQHRLVMEGYGYRWYRVGGLEYLLDRSEVETTRPAKGGRARKTSRQ
jgi:maltose alpha-D-glucosyltransferase/alpha-amylase